MANPPRKRSWKDGAPGSKSRPVEEPWRKDQGAVRSERPWWRSKRASIGFVTAALMLVIAIIIVVVRYWHPVNPMHLVLIGPGYEPNLFVPHNVSGHNGVMELKRIHDDKQWGNGNEADVKSDFSAIKIALEDPLLYTTSRFGKAKTVVVFVSAHGIARLKDDHLTPYLVPNNDNLHSAATLYPLDELLALLKKLPADTPKLLLLDVTQVSAHWPLGELHNDFARALNARAEDIKKKVEKLVVISSSDEDQRSWVSPEWGQTYFAHFVIEGLKGAADGAGTGKKNGRVDALELFQYVRNEVKRWVWHNRGRLQTPVKFGVDDDRARNLELVNCGDYQADYAVPKVDEKKYEKDYEAAWEKCRELRRELPHPSAYAPHLWRRYLDVLLRVEQLLRSGAADKVKEHLSEVEDLYTLIVQCRSLDDLKKSAQLTLAMPDALGLQRTAHVRNELIKIVDFGKLESEKKEDRDKALTEALTALKKLPANDSHALIDLVIHKVAEEPERRLVLGRHLLGSVDPVAPDCRTAEAHYLMMLADNLPLLRPEVEAGKRWPLVQTSLQLRRRAELAALGLDEKKDGERLPAYSEQVLPWIQEMIKKADRPRRLGQDLLFASSTAEWDQAKKLLNEDANPGYMKAQDLAVKIRRALDLRDRLYAELPYYTHWVAERGSEHEVDVVVQLWNELHKLRRLLEKPIPGEEGIAQAAQRIAEDFKRIQGWVEQSAEKENPTNQDRWHEIEAVLAVPFLEPDRRKSLIDASFAISRKLLLENPLKEGDAGIPSGEENRKRARAAALRQGRLALAMLGGDDWPEEFAKAKNAIDLADEGEWYRSVARAGERIGRFLNELPEMADKQCEEAAGQDNLDKAAALLQSATRYARTIDGAAARTRMTRNPIDEQRRLNMHHLLCWQAHRTFLDWWAELGQTPPRPYFQRAGTIFLDDAKQLVMGRSAQSTHEVRGSRLEQVEKERANLKPVQVIVERSERRSEGDFHPGPARFDLTPDEDDVEWLYRLRGPQADKVPGQPVVWVKADGALRIAAKDVPRRPIAFDDPFRVKITTDRTPTGAAKHSVKGFFRGHYSEVETSVSMQRPDRVVSLPPLAGRGHVAVQTKKSLYDLYGAQNTAIALVLDCSGSMEYVPMSNSRFKRAIGVMRSVLKQLPKDVTISLRTFGAEQDQKENIAENPYGIKLAWRPAPWDPDKLNDRMKEIAKLKPHGPTPLVHSIAAAKKDLPEEKKARSIVVITDGGDSTFYKDENRRKGDTIKSFLRREFADSDIQVSVIGFEAKELPKEEKEGDIEFRQALPAINGQFYDADNTDLLMEYLTRSLLHMYFQVYPDNGRDVADRQDEGENISQSEKNWRWVHLDPDIYRIRVPSLRSLKQQIDIRPGDALLLDLVSGLGGRPEFRRGTYAESDYMTREHSQIWTKNQKDWLLAVLQNYQLQHESNKLQLMATLEKTERTYKTLSPDLIRVIHPDWVWFDVSAPKGVKAKPTLRVTSLPDYPADAWGLEVSDWPRDRPAATLQAWWIEHSPRPRTALFKPRDFDTLLNLRPRRWLTDPQLGDVVLTGVELKRCDIQVEGRPSQKVNCLVVSLSYPPEKEPFFVRFSNDPDRKTGKEHHFYTSAGKYTGIFWPVTEEVVQNIEWLELFSVAELKKAALGVEKLELGHPNDISHRPPSVRSVREER
jgi:Mg-chelatase subunit ChlD